MVRSKKKNTGNAGKGREKGSTNKITRNLKELVLETVAALEKEGKSLSAEAEKDPKWFYLNFVKPMLPKDIDLKATGELTVVINRLSTKK